MYYAFLLMLLGFGACDEDMQIVKINETVPANELSALSQERYILLHDGVSDVFDTLEWTTPDYGFDAFVTYTVQMAIAGFDFENAIDIATVTDLSVVLTNGDVNEALLELDATPETVTSVEFRVVATINDGVDAVYSNVQAASITPHTSYIYLLGDGQSWDLSQVAELDLSSGVYSGKADLVEGGGFRFFADADWNADQWGWSYFDGGDIDDNLSDAADEDSNFIFNGESGQYRVTVSFADKSITLEEANDPVLYLIGAPNEWSLNNDLQMMSLDVEGDFEIILTLTDQDNFRFFEGLDWAASQYRYTDFTGGSIDEKLTYSEEDADANFIFNGDPGIYKISVSISEQTISVEEADTPTLYIIGTDQDWDETNPFPLTWVDGGKFVGETTFSTDAIFRFFETPSWEAVQYNYNYFLNGTIDTEHLSGTTEGDANLTFIGATGTYTITVNVNAAEVSMTE